MSKISRSHGNHYNSREILRCVVLLTSMLLICATFYQTSKKIGMTESLHLFDSTASVDVKKALRTVGVQSPPEQGPYQPAPVEHYIVTHTKELGFSVKPPEQYVLTCQIWQDPQASPYYAQLHQFFAELKDYYARLNQFFLPPGVKDIRYDSHPDGSQDVCQLLDLDPQGLEGIFKSQQLSRTPKNGFIEPLLTPMRHPIMCTDPDVPRNPQKYNQLVQIRYLVHDWANICRSLKPNSKTIFIDMGASLQFHGTNPSPALVLLEQFRRFGIVFDHIYGYEMKPLDPRAVQEAIPKQFRSAYHWINVGVDSDPGSMHNPWKFLIENFEEDDLVVVKLDIDNPSIERPLAHQLLNNPQLAKLVDHFYFEHHVNQWEMAAHWGATQESVEDSFQLFHALRQRGIASHFWV